ncbi:MAG: hypothetical protein KGJ00_03350 [Bradyrhizobium sp.]|nr:hypothetical protein [Bradyrhizobium sp.]
MIENKICKSPALPGFCFFALHFSRTRNSSAPTATVAKAGAITGNESAACVLQDCTLERIVAQSLAMQRRGLPFKGEQKKMRLRSHLSA